MVGLFHAFVYSIVVAYITLKYPMLLRFTGGKCTLTTYSNLRLVNVLPFILEIHFLILEG